MLTLLKLVLLFLFFHQFFLSSSSSSTVKSRPTAVLFCEENERQEFGSTCDQASSPSCVAKCCAKNQVWDIGKGGCEVVRNGIYWRPTKFYEAVGSKCVVVSTTNEDENETATTTGAGGGVNCKIAGQIGTANGIGIGRQGSENEEEDEVVWARLVKNCSAVLLPFKNIEGMAGQRFRLVRNGSVLLRDKYGSWHEIRAGSFCVDGIQKSQREPYGGNDGVETMVWACQGEHNFKRFKTGIQTTYVVLLSFASVLYFLTALVYVLLWKLNGVYEWLIFCNVISNLFMIVFVGVGHSIARDPENTDLGSFYCILIGAAAHFFILASFTWTFMLCFELWWTFRARRQVNRKTLDLKRLGLYKLFGWGAPGLTVSIGMGLDHIFGLWNLELDCSPLSTPNYGLLNCYLSKPAQGPYMHYPIGVILFCNLVFFTLTVLQMRKHRRAAAAARTGSIIRKTKKQMHLTILFTKLFAIMGLSWIFTLGAWLISSAKSPQQSGEDAGVPLHWIIYDIVITLQAVAIFFIFAFKQDILNKLWRSYPSLRGALKPFTYLPNCQLQPGLIISSEATEPPPASQPQINT